MSIYRVPFWTHGARARTKAQLAYGDRPADGVVTFTASSRVIAELRLRGLILPGDDRPIQGRTKITEYRVEAKS